MATATSLARSMPFDVNLWKPQNGYYQLLKSVYPEMAERTDDGSRYWTDEFRKLGEQLKMRVEVEQPMPVAA